MKTGRPAVRSGPMGTPIWRLVHLGLIPWGGGFIVAGTIWWTFDEWYSLIVPMVAVLMIGHLMLLERASQRAG